MFSKNSSIANKLTSIMMITSCVTLIVGSIIIMTLDAYNFRTEMEDKYNVIAKINTLSGAPALLFKDKTAAKENLNVFSAETPIDAAIIVSSDGNLFSSYLAKDTALKVDTVFTAYNQFKSENNHSCDQNAYKENHLQVCSSITLDDETIGSLFMLIKADYYYEWLTIYIAIMSGIISLAIILAYLLARKLGKLISEPILDLASTIKLITEEKDYSTIARKESNDEIGHLTDGFNNMLFQIRQQQQALLEHQKQLETKVKIRTQELQLSMDELEHSKQQADAANQAKSEFLSRMSHELRTPLNAILGFGQLIQMDEINNETLEHADEIINAGEHLLALITEVLDLSKIESGNIDITLEKIEINQIISECISLIHPLSQQRDIEIIDTISNVSNHTIYADSIRLKQVVINLLSNAVKYNRKGGTITIDDEIPSPGTLRIRFTDTGLGLTTEQQALLFNPFERMGAELTSIEGTGIGLVITERLMKLMGGAMGVISEPQKGSTFWIEINLSNHENKKKQIELENNVAENRALTTLTQKKILLIEDNIVNTQLIEAIIKKHTAHTVISSITAITGLLLAEKDQPDMILMDINLPDMNGYMALKKLQENPLTCHIPVIAISANALADDINKGQSAGFSHYISKPINIKHFLNVITTQLSETNSNT